MSMAQKSADKLYQHRGPIIDCALGMAVGKFIFWPIVHRLKGLSLHARRFVTKEPGPNGATTDGGGGSNGATEGSCNGVQGFGLNLGSIGGLNGWHFDGYGPSNGGRFFLGFAQTLERADKFIFKERHRPSVDSCWWLRNIWVIRADSNQPTQPSRQAKNQIERELSPPRLLEDDGNSVNQQRETQVEGVLQQPTRTAEGADHPRLPSSEPTSYFKDPLYHMHGPMTRGRAKKMREALNMLITNLQAQEELKAEDLQDKWANVLLVN